MLMCKAGRDGSAAGAVDDEDFIQAFEDVPTVQVRSLWSNNEHSTLHWIAPLKCASSCPPADPLQQGGGGEHDEDPGRPV